jgi:hypothetical protein
MIRDLVISIAVPSGAPSSHFRALPAPGWNPAVIAAACHAMLRSAAPKVPNRYEQPERQMKPSEMRIVSLPLRKLWDDAGRVEASRRGFLGPVEIRNLLRRGPVRFVVTDVGGRLRWTERENCYSFWKQEIKDHICQGDQFSLDDYPKGYCYVISEWALASGERVLLAEMHH